VSIFRTACSEFLVVGVGADRHPPPQLARLVPIQEPDVVVYRRLPVGPQQRHVALTSSVVLQVEILWIGSREIRY
jgi:hypothetical protein